MSGAPNPTGETAVQCVVAGTRMLLRFRLLVYLQDTWVGLAQPGQCQNVDLSGRRMNAIDRGKRKPGTIRNPPGKDLAHERGREAAKGYSYEHSKLQDRDLHRLQHKHDDFGRANKERPPEQPSIRVMSAWERRF